MGGGGAGARIGGDVVASSPVTEHFDLNAGDGLRLHVDRAGTGPPVFLLHGFTGCADVWTGLGAVLEKEYAVYRVDMPGHGRSSAPSDSARYSLDRFAGDLAGVLDLLHIERTVVLGYSMGGRAALRFALHHPSRVAALILESISPGIADARDRAERHTSDIGIAERIEQDGLEAFVDYWERLPIFESQVSLPVGVRARLRAQRLAGDAHGLAGSLRGAGAGADPAVTELLGALRVPALLIAGSRDRKYVTAGEYMREIMPDACMRVVEDAGHCVHLEQPDAFATIVREFLGGLPSASSEWG